MKFKNLNGKEKNINISNYLVDWNKKERSIIQFKVKKFLEPFWKNHVVCSELPLVSTRCTFDLYNASRKIVVEIQGKQHYSFNKHFHKSSRTNYLGQIKRDLDKQKYCEINNILLIEVMEDEVDNLSKEWFKEKYDIDL